jgi:hypothetical protein
VQKRTKFDSSQSNAAKWATDGVTITGVLNRCEFGGSGSYVYGNGLNVASSGGTITGGTCVIKPIGPGSTVTVSVAPNASGGGTTHSFFADNSGQ